MHAVAVAIPAFVFVLVACSSRPVASVHDRSTPLRQPETLYREVRAGDTLYSIAWESGRDYSELASWNDLQPPFTIHPGQKIRLHPPASKRAVSATTRRNGDYRIVAHGDTLYGIARATGVAVPDLAAWNALRPPYLLQPGQRLRLFPPNKTVSSRTPGKTTVRAAPSNAAKKTSTVESNDAPRTVAWIWPTEGKLVTRFSPGDGAKGIDIAGRAGQPIQAAAPGTVVYQGSGLRGYGQLIIVKHNADFLSAYAHCAEIYVQEGSVIKPGQKIAAMGSTGTDSVKLHFEIRRRGVPVDPLEYLPKK